MRKKIEEYVILLDVKCCINLYLSTTEKQYSGDKYGGMYWVFKPRLFVWEIVHTKQKYLMFQGAT